MKTFTCLATLLWLGTGLAIAQPLEQSFTFGAPPDVLGNDVPHGVRPVPQALKPVPVARRRGVRTGRQAPPRRSADGRRR